MRDATLIDTLEFGSDQQKPLGQLLYLRHCVTFA